MDKVIARDGVTLRDNPTLTNKVVLRDESSNKVALEFPDIARRLQTLTLPEVDLVVGIATGGMVPASLVAYELACSLKVLAINYRDEANRPRREVPELLEPFALPGTLPGDALRILLVDDVSVSGKTLELAKRVLTGHEVTTLVFKGKGDLVVLPEVRSCVAWPWQPASDSSATTQKLSTAWEER